MHQKTVAEISAALHAGEVSSRELTDALLKRIETYDPGLNSLITVTAEQARAAADAADARLRAGEAGPLTGVPLVHKDIFCTDGVATTCGSRMLEPFRAPYDATVVRRLAEAGVVMLGKANMDEFAMGSSNETSYFGPVRNPWDLDAVPGGSSGGSAAAVAARLAPAATGTDTGGSIRQPAALSGICGLKPTYGRVSRYGMVAFASSLDQAGPFARTAEDLALLLGPMAGLDERDSTSVDHVVPDYSESLNRSIKGLRIGVPREFFGEGLDPDVRSRVEASLQVLEGEGAELVEVQLPNMELALPAYYVIAPAEASSNLARFDGVRFGHRCADPQDLEDLYKRSRAEGFGDEVQRRILVGTYALSAGYYDAYYRKAQQIRRLVADDFRQALEQVDVLAGPTSPTPAFDLGERADDPVQMYLSDIYTLGVNLAGLPGLSVPAGFSRGRPVGLQLIGGYFDEARLLNVGHKYQQVTDWHKQVPEGFE
ncbi:MAG: Asp-tRNA(Asn)/Glu-tRNA(Gln) amidotransferase subunit GatA [Halorhodospira halophila]|uniref:Asp-tRNA(Asn)/Glu-tRNA(Gln) amidotransferase subunit GatA n=1 Tax=Halorhodospira TaxID=85108 RepID=UPI00191319AD|nr:MULTISPECIES: Asp-tRNA(Asn)/Glu-tRNA(Gln) amidotransferase subunit GatA [Halorhodospira]MBK5935977.1 aspartyl/glutamyl-tRNA amidotransferase subunit A [Halorhodospira halophila]MBK5943381.1 aspartyl/glutamyl-tRNA amidotransferase subunit A [Halorhodospira halophila]MCC3751045.1 Asp-tRNA(Asn)/Glu-tRNA(Gln) amidotransferase subunit GatA [Halorhodospira halophila]MCG5526911.1 Asp-tRNA(Asn)/Glu-tRNA(Gln) amidotransferase subunit GatA [Halorhodospira halophila]MCG5533169.1 Asp-tRNA(Asn)/Glu-tRNA